MTVPLSSWVITVKVIEFEKSLLETPKFFSRFLNTLTNDDKYYLISRDNWMQTIEMHFSQKQTVFSESFSAYFESPLNFELFEKRMTLIAYVFPNLPATKDVVREISESSVWESLSVSDMVNGPKHWLNINESTFIILIDHCEANWVAKITLRDMKIL